MPSFGSLKCPFTERVAGILDGEEEEEGEEEGEEEAEGQEVEGDERGGCLSPRRE